MNCLRTRVNYRDADSVTIYDRGLQFGDGLFETIAVREELPLLWLLHWARLQRGCGLLGIQPPEEQRLTEEIKSLCQGVDKGIVKLVLTRGNSSRGYALDKKALPNLVLYLFSWPENIEARRAQGAHLRLCRTRLASGSFLAGVKHLNRLEQVLAKAELAGEQEEGLMLNTAGDVVEGVSTNVFALIGDRLQTPDLSGCGVQGVMREHILMSAPELGIDVRITTLTPGDLIRAHEVFLTNSIIGIWPVKQFQQTVYAPGLVTERLTEHLRQSYC
ncbi:MAG: aminodeoxychorismate lyase [Gammaproteobacteria bacterium]|nr:aminodeoxychorismate lyase [Gammaproteobacteria bacterium]